MLSFSKFQILWRWKEKKKLCDERWISKWFFYCFRIFLNCICFLMIRMNNWNKFQNMKHVDRFHRFVFNKVESFILNLFLYSHKQYHDSVRRKLSITSTMSYISILFIHLFILLTSYVNFFVKFRSECDDKFDKHALSSQWILFSEQWRVWFCWFFFFFFFFTLLYSFFEIRFNSFFDHDFVRSFST